MKFNLFLLIVCSATFASVNSAQNKIITKNNELNDATEAVFAIALRLRTLGHENENKNFLISPLSAALTVGQLMLGADGDLKKNLHSLLTLPNKNKKEFKDDDYFNFHKSMGKLVARLQKKTNYILDSHNGIFYNYNIAISELFDHESKTLYKSQLYPVNFKLDYAKDFINSWAFNVTRGLIPTLLPHPPSPTTAAIIANAVYFKGEWDEPFSSELNHDGPFKVKANQYVDATFMVNLFESIPFAETEKYKVIALPYKNNDASMFFILPKPGHPYEYNTRKFVESLGTENILNIISNMTPTAVTVKIPKLKIITSLSLTDLLKKFIIYKNATRPNSNTNANNLSALEDMVNKFDKFNPDKDVDLVLSAAADQDQLVVSDIVQQVYFSVNENGTEAAAITAATVDRMGGAKTFLANKPFVFFIQQHDTNVTFFYGNVNNPNAD